MAPNSSIPTPTSTWPRKRHDGRPIVGYQCTRCDHEIELIDGGKRVAHDCPHCPLSSRRTAVYERESSATAAVERLRTQLARHHGIAVPTDEPACAVCGTTSTVRLDPGTGVEDLQWRCDDHHRFDESFWYLPGDWPTTVAGDRLYRCECCGAEYPLPFGVIALDSAASESAYSGTRHYRCFACLDVEWLRAWFDE